MRYAGDTFRITVLKIQCSMEKSKTKFVSFSSIQNVADAIHRLTLLQDVGPSLNPPVEAAINTSGLITKQALVHCSHTFVKKVSSANVFNLSRQVAHFHEYGLVHGDLCRSNVGVQGEKVYVFDWEPALVLSNCILRTTPYCVHPHDLKERNLTALTDRFAVLFLGVISQHPGDDLSVLHKTYKSQIVDFLQTFSTHRIDNCVEKYLSYLRKTPAMHKVCVLKN
jgi:hypothetical protein